MIAIPVWEQQLDFVEASLSSISPDLLGAVPATSEQSPAQQQVDTDGGEIADSFIEDIVEGGSTSSEEEG